MRVALIAAALLVAAALSGCAGTSETTVTVTKTVTVTATGGQTTTAPPPPAPRIDLRDDSFSPNRTQVAPGTTVTLVNVGMHNHTVTIHYAPDPTTQTIKDTTLTPQTSTTHTFALPGTYHVWCKFHGTMTTGMAMVVTVA